MKKIFFLLPIVFFIAIAGCNKDDSDTIYASFSYTSLEVDAETTEYAIYVTCVGGVEWTISEDEDVDWAYIDGNLTRDTSTYMYLKMEQNLDTLDREVTLNLQYFSDSLVTSTLVVTQLAEPKEITLATDTLFVTYQEQQISTAVNSNLAWTATSNSSWATPVGTKTVVEKELFIDIEENTDLGFRMCTLTVKQDEVDYESTLVIYQDGLASLSTDSLMLVDLYNSTGGSNWTTKWNFSEPLSSWHGVRIDEHQGIQRVVEINLANNNLVGEIPSTITNISYLESIQLQNNSLTGEIPTFIGDLHYLQYLYLYNNNLTGEIPTEVVTLYYLARLHLGGNLLEGSIPSELGDLTRLEVLGLENNNLTGTLPESLGSTTTLQSIFVQGNRLSGTIPSAYLNNVLWKTWSYQNYICPQQSGYSFYNCPE
ncbi:MAG: hypothetical protein R3Y50_02820 [Rikenellaceae bacterium]